MLVRLDPGLPGVRWTAAEQIHLTLAFLGQVETEMEEKLQDASARDSVLSFFPAAARARHFPGQRPPESLLARRGARPSASLSAAQARHRRRARRRDRTRSAPVAAALYPRALSGGRAAVARAVSARPRRVRRRACPDRFLRIEIESAHARRVDLPDRVERAGERVGDKGRLPSAFFVLLTRIMKRILVLVALGALLGLTNLPAAEAPPAVIALKAARLFDGKSKTLLPNGVVLVAGQNITRRRKQPRHAQTTPR